MKVGAVSGDLLVKLALAGVAVAGVYYMTNRAKGAVSEAISSAVAPVSLAFDNAKDWYLSEAYLDENGETAPGTVVFNAVDAAAAPSPWTMFKLFDTAQKAVAETVTDWLSPKDAGHGATGGW